MQHLIMHGVEAFKKVANTNKARKKEEIKQRIKKLLCQITPIIVIDIDTMLH